MQLGKVLKIKTAVMRSTFKVEIGRAGDGCYVLYDYPLTEVSAGEVRKKICMLHIYDELDTGGISVFDIESRLFQKDMLGCTPTLSISGLQILYLREKSLLKLITNDIKMMSILACGIIDGFLRISSFFIKGCPTAHIKTNGTHNFSNFQRPCQQFRLSPAI